MIPARNKEPRKCDSHTFLCVPSGVILRTRLRPEVQVLGFCFALPVVVILAVCSRVLLSSVPGLFFTFMGFGATATCDAV